MLCLARLAALRTSKAAAVTSGPRGQRRRASIVMLLPRDLLMVDVERQGPGHRAHSRSNVLPYLDKRRAAALLLQEATLDGAGTTRRPHRRRMLVRHVAEERHPMDDEDHDRDEDVRHTPRRAMGRHRDRARHSGLEPKLLRMMMMMMMTMTLSL